MDLDGAVVAVVGGSSGMGLAAAKAAKAEGADVAIAGRDNERLEAAARTLGGARTFSLDVADEPAVRAMFEDLGRVEHVAVLPGEQFIAPLVSTPPVSFRRSMDVRFWGAFYVCRYAAPRMRGGSITLCSGVGTWRPAANRSVGVASSGAVEAFGRAMAVELAPTRVNTLCPGPVGTPAFDRFFGEQRDAVATAMAERLPAGRIGDADDIGAAILFLMTNAYVTGITLVVDGGFLLG